MKRIRAFLSTPVLLPGMNPDRSMTRLEWLYLAFFLALGVLIVLLVER